MIYTLFFSRLNDEMTEEERTAYEAHNAAVLRRAQEEHSGGFVDIKSFVAEDGERLSVVRFRDRDTQRAWRIDPDHREAQRKGRETYYGEYRIVVCEEIDERAWERAPAVEA